MGTSRTPNLTAVRALRRSARDADPATRCLLVLAATLAAELDGGVAAGQPGYVVAKLAASYGNVLQLLTQLVGQHADSPLDRFLAELSQPASGRFDGAANG
jgi:hypothetical protein